MKEVRPICSLCRRNLPKGCHFGSVHKNCYDNEIAIIRETHGEEAEGHIDGFMSGFCEEDLIT